MSVLLEMKKISKSFPGVRALHEVDFSVQQGEIHCLIGANGAGKSTLMKALAGVLKEDSGEILFNGESISVSKPSDSLDLGITTIYQELSLVEELTVGENVYIGRYFKKKSGLIDWKLIHEKTRDCLAFMEMDIHPKTRVGDLSMGKKQLVEIAKAIAADSKLIIMDEPSTALSEGEVEKLFHVMKELKKQGMTIIYISHKLDELYAIGDRVTVLRNGEYVLTEALEDITKQDLIKAITGRQLGESRVATSVEEKEEYVRVENFCNHKLKNISFEVKKGEILGLYGLVGAGRTEVLRAIYGADSIDAGSLTIDGKKRVIRSPKDAVKLGMGLLPENRKTEGAVLDLSITENAVLPSLGKFSSYSFLNGRKVKSKVKEAIKKLNVKTASQHTLMRQLSGGNQQKVIISKWLLHESELMLFDEPTQGIDIGAKAEIYDIMKELASKGTSVLVTSAEVDELLLVCDRVLVMFEGRIIKEFNQPSGYKSDILHAAVSGE
ncbi:sugar ABC transporter ATP-binding protein [Alkalicoccobacillus porphyridii]|nr:sugar ABC transporter ATP-binding protein [Alkalicoccobacillus porphyridii]